MIKFSKIKFSVSGFLAEFVFGSLLVGIFCVDMYFSGNATAFEALIKGVSLVAVCSVIIGFIFGALGIYLFDTDGIYTKTNEKTEREN